MPYKLAIFQQVASLTGKKRFLTGIRYRTFSGKKGRKANSFEKGQESNERMSVC